MIAVIGKLPDVAPYRDQPGYDVYPDMPADQYRPADSMMWLQRAMDQGDWIQVVGETATGMFAVELEIVAACMSQVRK